MIPAQYNWQNLKVRKGTTFAAAGGIALVVFVLAAALMLDQGIRRTMSSTGSPRNAIVLRKGSDAELASGIDNQTKNIILGAPGIAQKNGQADVADAVVIVAALDKVDTDGQVSNVMVRGLSDNGLTFRKEVKVVQGRAPAPGTDEVMIGERLEGRFVGLNMNGTIALKKNRPFKVVGVFTAEGSSFESEVWGPLDSIRSAFGRESVVSSVTVRLESLAAYNSFAAAVKSDQRLGLDVMRESEYYEKAGEQTATFMKVMGIVIAVFFSFCAILGAMITMHGAVAQRQREIGTLRALGFSKKSVLGSFLLESIMVSLLGGLVGLAAATALGMVKFSMMNFATWSEVVFSFTPTLNTLIVSLVVGVIMGVMGGFLPALRAARVTPVQAMRG